MSKSKANHFHSRIKKLMQSDEDVGKVAAGSPALMARAVELLIMQLAQGACQAAADRAMKTVTPSHVKAFIAGEKQMDFLIDKVADVLDLPAQGATPQKSKRKRPAAKTDGSITKTDAVKTAAKPRGRLKGSRNSVVSPASNVAEVPAHAASQAHAHTAAQVPAAAPGHAAPEAAELQLQDADEEPDSKRLRQDASNAAAAAPEAARSLQEAVCLPGLSGTATTTSQTPAVLPLAAAVDEDDYDAD